MKKTEVNLVSSVEEGVGVLREWGKKTPEFPVDYHFDVVTKVSTMPGVPPASGQRCWTGQITGHNDKSFPQGFYQLDTEHGESIKVQKIGGSWHRLATP